MERPSGEGAQWGWPGRLAPGRRVEGLGQGKGNPFLRWERTEDQENVQGKRKEPEGPAVDGVDEQGFGRLAEP